MAVMKVIELMGDSSKSFEDAIDNAIEEASKSVKGMKSAWVKDQSVVITNGKASSYRVVMKITFEINR